MAAIISRSPAATLISLVSLYLLLLWCTTTTTFIRKQLPVIITATQSTKQDQVGQQHYIISLPTRRALKDKSMVSPSTQFDFTPFIHGRQDHRHQHPAQGSPEIDSRYDVEMRLVPTGPNPLHH
ncbi:hypothetical protein SSX86_013943 [Deinandra increscens subsp. villosa]|uniref:CLAVATA3/ESR (CLE)-related protein 13 n=1 Tax=Deinandra increscens subsp. villosa TaxID=3103831 RepID=A0AAP0D5M5_9ASTR